MVYIRFKDTENQYYYSLESIILMWDEILLIADHLQVEFYVYIIQLAILISRDLSGYITPETGVNFWPQVALNADL